uniref:Calmodulin n=1 Tax=Romanomermis culicivorax TaxID=13658 RepID=A0A915L3R7_ROMCU
MDELIKCIGFGICATKEAIIKDLENIVYPKVCLKYRLPSGDLPPAEDLKQKLAQTNEKNWHPLNRKTCKLLNQLDEFLKNDVTRLIQALPSDTKISVADYGPLATEGRINAGQFEREMQWSNVSAQAERRHWRRTFESLPLDNGKLHAADARAFLLKSGLPQAVLGEILKLVDTDGDNQIDLEEFYLLSFLIDRKLAGKDIPKILPASVLPPSSHSKSSQKRSADSKDDLVNKLQASLEAAEHDGKKSSIDKSRESKAQRCSSTKKSSANPAMATKKTSSVGVK